MNRIIIAREAGETHDVTIHYGLHKHFAQADMEILKIEDPEHARVDRGLGSGNGHRAEFLGFVQWRLSRYHERRSWYAQALHHGRASGRPTRSGANRVC